MILYERNVSNYKLTLIKDCLGTSPEPKKGMKLRGVDLTSDSNRHDKSITPPIQSKICINADKGQKLNQFLLYYFRDPSPEPDLECEEALSPSPDQMVSRPTSRAASTPPPILTPHPPSPNQSSPASSPGHQTRSAANPPKGADGPYED